MPNAATSIVERMARELLSTLFRDNLYAIHFANIST